MVPANREPIMTVKRYIIAYHIIISLKYYCIYFIACLDKPGLLQYYKTQFRFATIDKHKRTIRTKNDIHVYTVRNQLLLLPVDAPSAKALMI